MSILDLGAGLGGPARIWSKSSVCGSLAAKFPRNWPALEWTCPSPPAWPNKAPIEHLDALAPDLAAKKYNVVFAFDTFCRVEDKNAFIDAIVASLKPKAQVIFRDLVAGEGTDSDDAMKQWKNIESQPVHLWTVDEYTDALTSRGLSIGLSPLDLTDDYCERVINGWWKAQRQLIDLKRAGGADPNLLKALGREVELWTLRTKALQSGALAVYRVYGDRK